MNSIIRLFYRQWPRAIRNMVHAKRHQSKIHSTCSLARGAEVIRSELDFKVYVAYHGSIRRSHVGRYSSIGRYSKIADATIGAFCSISWDCTIGAHNHPLTRLTSHQFPFTPEFRWDPRQSAKNLWRANTRKVILGNDVWVAANSVILDGVKVSNGSVIGAGSVVTKDVEPYCVVAGVPARVLRPRFSEEICERLKNICWWQWSDSILREHIHLFQADMDLDIITQLEQVCASLKTH